MILTLFFPAYKSYKTLTQREKDEEHQEKIQKWLTYWTILALYNVFGTVIDLVGSFMPYYGILKLGFFISIYNGQTHLGTTLYNSVFKPALETIDPYVADYVAIVETALHVNPQ